MLLCLFLIFFFNDTATTEIYTLSLHDALPISRSVPRSLAGRPVNCAHSRAWDRCEWWQRNPRSRDQSVLLIRDRKSTRLNSSHANISYAVFCLKKKKDHDREHIKHIIAWCTIR